MATNTPRYVTADEQGFLTGRKISKEELLNDFRAIESRLKSIDKSIADILSIMKRGGKKQTDAVIAKKAATPTPSGEKNRGVTPAEKKAEKASEPAQIKASTPAEKTLKAAKVSVSVKVDAPQPSTAKQKAGTKQERPQANRAAEKSAAQTFADEVAKAANAQRAATPEPRGKRAPGPANRTMQEAETPKRDASGRFVKKGVDGAGEEGSSPYRDAAFSLMSDRFASKVADAVTESTDSVSEVDPAVKAVTEAVEPFARGYKLFSDAFGNDEQIGWLRKILMRITSLQKSQSEFHKADQKANKATLEAIKGNGAKASVGEGGGFLSNLMPKVGGGLATLGGFMAKKIPLLASLFAVGKGLFDITSIENDPTLTRREKDTRGGKAAFGTIGTVGGILGGAKAGAAIGTMLGGPVGTVIGGLVGSAAGAFFGGKAGEIVGETVGGWVSDIREFDIPGKIMTAWTGLTDGCKAAWDTVMGTVSGFWDGAKKTASEYLSSVNSWIKDKTGVDVGATLSPAVDSIKRIVKAAGTALGFGNGTKTKNGTWELGQTSAQFESGGRGAGTISTGRGDKGGKSYGEFQLSSKAGTLQKYLAESKYAKEFEGKAVGSKAFDDQWKQLAATDPDFAKEQKNFIKRTHYDKAMAGLAESGIDLSKRGRAVQDAVWSTSVQFGAGSTDSKAGAVPMIRAALGGRDASQMSDLDIINAIQNYKIANNQHLFAGSSWSVRQGTYRRAINEKARLANLAMADAAEAPTQDAAAPALALGATMTAMTSPAVSSSGTTPAPRPMTNARVAQANMRVPKVGSIAANRQIPTPKPVVVQPVPINTDQRGEIKTVRIEGDVGQDVRERGIAHIATGGLSQSIL